MTESVFLDTSGWILVFRKEAKQPFKEYVERLLAEKKIVIAPIVILELLTGTKNQQDYNELFEDLSALQCLEINSEVWQNAYNLSFNLRRHGHTIATGDILIAGLCLKYNSLLLHADKHFELIKKFCSLRTQMIT